MHHIQRSLSRMHTGIMPFRRCMGLKQLLHDDGCQSLRAEPQVLVSVLGERDSLVLPPEVLHQMQRLEGMDA